MKKPWYIWFSVFGFLGVFLATAFKIFVKNRPIDMNTWLLCWGKVAFLMFVVFALPIILLTLLMGWLSGINALAGTIMNVVVLVCVYVLGVVIADNLYRWSAENVK